MHLANLTTATIKRTSGLLIAVLFSTISYAQENSPYSYYGLGDIAPNRNVISRGMAGISSAVSDFQSINFTNPAGVAALASTVFDVGGSIDIRTLKSNTSPDKFKSVNTSISYLQLGFPLKANVQKGRFWAMSFGLRPITRINYKISESTREPQADSLLLLREGNGGLSQANISTAIKIKNFSLGISSGYAFGSDNYSRKKEFINDTVTYQKSNSEIQTTFGGIFLTIGAQYEFFLNKAQVEKDVAAKKTPNRKYLRIGAYTNLQQNLKAKRDDLNETFNYDGNGGITTIDTVSFTKGKSGTIKYPSTYSFGFSYSDNHWLVGADLDMANWASYTSFGQKDPNVQDNYTIRAGAQYFPANLNTVPSKYWSFVKYRAGVYYGDDYININETRPEYGATFGAGLPLTSSKQRNAYGGFAILNLGVEIGARGSKTSQSIRESVTRFSIGFSMNSRWFQKVRYD